MFQLWGGDIINMTAVPEVVLANEASLCYAAIAMVTDYDCWRDDHEPVGCGLSGGWWGYLEFDTLTPFQTKMCSSRKYSFSPHRRFFVYHLLTPPENSSLAAYLSLGISNDLWGEYGCFPGTTQYHKILVIASGLYQLCKIF